MNEQFDNYIVVIRSAGERTVELCEKLIRNDISPNVKCFTIKCNPFEEAIKKSFQLGIESGKDWLVTVDADVLVRSGGISDLLEKKKSMPDNVFQYEGFLYDGLLLRYRQGGVKVYRTALLSKALDKIPLSGTQIRPETFTQDEMAKEGYFRKRVDVVTGIHDYEQYYRDVFRKCYVHAIKHKNSVIDLFPLWNKLSKNDLYYKAAILGAIEGFMSNEKIVLDVDYFRENSELVLSKFNINEKNKMLDDINSNMSYVNDILKNAGEFNSKSISKIIDIYKANGFIILFRWIVAKILVHISKKIFPSQL